MQFRWSAVVAVAILLLPGCSHLVNTTPGYEDLVAALQDPRAELGCSTSTATPIVDLVGAAAMLASGVLIVASPDVSDELESDGFPKGVTSAAAFGSSLGLAASAYSGFGNADACARLHETITATIPEDVRHAFQRSAADVDVADDLSGGQ